MIQPKFKFFAVITWVVCTAVPASDQVMPLSGTLIVVFYDRDQIFIGADSRQGSQGITSDKACKITRLGDNAFFAESGLEKIESVNTSDVRQVTEKWADMIMQAYKPIAEANPRDFIKDRPSWQIISGVFGANSGGKLATYEANIGMCMTPNPKEDDSFLPVFSSHVWGPINPHLTKTPMRIYGSGAKFAIEFFQARAPDGTPRAKRAFERMDQATVSSSPNEKVEAMIEYAIHFASDVSPNKEVGGDVDVLMLPQSGPSQWLKVKRECDDTAKKDQD